MDESHTTHAAQAAGAPNGQAWQDLQALIGQLDQLARTGLPPSDFYDTLLQHTTDTLAGIGGVVWIAEGDQSLLLAAQHGLEQEAEQWQFAPALHRELAAVVARQGKPQYLPPEGETSDHELGNDGPFGIYLVPIVLAQRSVGVLEFVQRGNLSAAAERGHQRLLQTVAEIAADYEQRREHERSRHYARDAAQLLDAWSQLQTATTSREAARTLANTATQVLDWDRVSFHSPSGRLRGASSAGQIDPRAQAVKSLCRVARIGKRVERPFLYPENEASPPPVPLDPRSGRECDRHLESTQASQLGVYPLLSPAPPHRLVGVLVGELFGERARREVNGELQDRLLRTAAGAFQQARAWERLPLSRWQRAWANRSWARAIWTTAKAVAWVALITALLYGLVMGRGDFHVRVQGELNPAQTREIFAPADGEISSLSVRDGDTVVAGAPLLTLRSPALDLQLQQVIGDIETARKRLEGVESARVRLDPSAADASTRLSQLSAEEQELRELLESKGRELSLLREQLQSFQMTSPLQGQVLAWDAERRLENRPVRRGQSLLAIADTEGPWQVRLWVSQDDFGHLARAAERDTEERLQVRFRLATDPDTAFAADVVELGRQTQWHEPLQQHVVPVLAELPGRPAAGIRPGSVIYGHITCGKRSLGYVWLHDLIDRLRGEWSLRTTSPPETEPSP